MADTWLRDLIATSYRHHAAAHGATALDPAELDELERIIRRQLPGDVKAGRPTDRLLRSIKYHTQDLARDLYRGKPTQFARAIERLRPADPHRLPAPFAAPPEPLGPLATAFATAKRRAYVWAATRAGQYAPSARRAAAKLFPIAKRISAQVGKRVLLPLGTAMDLYEIGRTGALGLDILREGAAARDLRHDVAIALAEGRIDVADKLARAGGAAIAEELDWILADAATTPPTAAPQEPYQPAALPRAPEPTRWDWGDFPTTEPPATEPPPPYTWTTDEPDFGLDLSDELLDLLEAEALAQAREDRQFRIDMSR